MASFTISMNKTIPIIFVEGGIGCGKSTLVAKIQEYCNNNNLKIKTIQEPVDIWMNIIDTVTGKNMIEAFYENQEKYSFEFQMMAYISRLNRLTEALKEAHIEHYDLLICERSLMTDRNVFCKMLYDEGKISSYGFQIYNKWFDYFADFNEQSKYVYLKCDYEVCYQRVQKRNRNGEKSIPIEYLKDNNHYHDMWLLNDQNTKQDSDNILILDGNVDAETDQSIYEQHISKIFSKFVKDKRA